MTKYRFYLAILALVGQLFLHGQAATEPLEAGDHAPAATSLSVSVPAKDRLNLVSFLPVIVDGVILARVAVYDDPASERVGDYLELYNATGDLLAVSWFDRFGIERLAVDRGLLEETGQLEGVFVVLLDGNSI